MKRIISGLMVVVLLLLAGCTPAAGATDDNGPITIAWYPNESGADLEATRTHLGELIEKATGRKVEHQLTTDYAIAIEALANGKADLAFMGAQGYTEARAKNDKVVPVVVPSGKDGTLETAVYYSWLIVKKGQEDEYKTDGKYAIDNIQGKRFSFVSNSSTSGFKIPSSVIVDYFGKQDKWAGLDEEALMEGGPDKFFSEVLYGGSHQGSAVNLLTDKVDVAAVCDTCVANYIEPVQGNVNETGTVYQVLADAAEPFNLVPGEQFVAISVTPVLNAPFAANLEALGQETYDKIVELMTSDEVAKDEMVFIPETSEIKGLFKKTGDERFLHVEDNWFDPIRNLGK